MDTMLMANSVAVFDDARSPDKQWLAYNFVPWWKIAYERKSAVGTPTNLWLVDVDKNSRVSQWPSTPVTRDNSVFCPPHRLLVNEFNGRFGLWLIMKGCQRLCWWYSPNKTVF